MEYLSIFKIKADNFLKIPKIWHILVIALAVFDASFNIIAGGYLQQPIQIVVALYFFAMLFMYLLLRVVYAINTFIIARVLKGPWGSIGRVELDFLTLAGIIILGIIAYELSVRGIAIPMFIWYLVGVLLFIYIMLLSVSTILLIFLWKERDN